MKTILLNILLIVLASLYSFSQTTSPDVIISSGDVTEGEDGSLSWTLGENLIESFGEIDLSLLQGFQEIEDFPVAIEEIEPDNATVIVYPTHTTGKVYVVFTGTDPSGYNARLVDMAGKVCDTYDFDSDHNEIDLGEFAYGMYLLIVLDNTNIPVGHFKIIRD